MDKRKAMPRESLRRGNGNPPRPPALWAFSETTAVEPEAVHGQYPRGFVDRILRELSLRPSDVLHVCSGALSRTSARGSFRVDVRRRAAPDVIADGRRLPFADGAFGAVFVDPPYSVEYAEELYGVEYPRPSHLLREAARVVRPLGYIGMLHYLVCTPPPGCSLRRVLGVTQGLGYRIRAWVEYQRDQAWLY